MKFALVLIASVAMVQASSRAGWSPSTPGWTTPPPTTAGWSTLPPTTQGWTTLPPTTQGWTTLPPTTQGWTTLPPTTQGWTTLPPTTQGWSTPPPTTQGWSTPPPTTGWPAPPPPPGWGPSPPLSSNIAINLAGGLAAVGDGWTAQNHQDAVSALGGWGAPASISLSSGGESIVEQDGNIVQATNVEGGEAASIQLVNVGQLADAANGLDVIVSGLSALVESSGASQAAGEGASAADASSSILASLS